MSKIRVADYIARRLEQEGVTRTFLLAGGGMMHLQDAVSRSEKIHYVCCHHEQSCAFAAEAYARATGKLGVCYATSGPGGTNTVTGIAQAWTDSTPVLFLVGQAKTSETIRGTGLKVRQFGTFEVDMVSIAEPITKYAAFVDDPRKIRYHLDKAIGLAKSGRPGPTLLEIPLNVQGALVEESELEPCKESLVPELPALSDAELDEVIDRLRAARRPLILAGHGVRVSGAAEKFRELVKRWNLPVATTPLANDLLPYEDPLLVGHPSLKGDRPGNIAVQTADVILTLGCSLHSMTTGYELKLFAPKAYKIQVEMDAAILRREAVGVQKKLQAPVEVFLERLAARPRAREPIAPEGAWHAHCRRLKSELGVDREPHARPDGQLNYYDVIFALNEHAKGDEILIADAGSAYYTLGQAYRARPRQRVIISGGLGQMGYTTSAVIGASSALPDRRVIGLTGDGSLQMNLHDLSVIAHHRLNAAMVVVNNGGYVSIRNTQNNYFGGFLSGTDAKSGLAIPDHRKLCAAFGLPYRSARTPDELGAGMREALSGRGGPVFFEVFTTYEQLILPTVQSQRLADGTMVSKPLHDMFPFLEPEKLKSYLLQD